ncbi:MAG TPA: ABC transporter substrate-binding protein [Streptosporangiaceae bacterium]
MRSAQASCPTGRGPQGRFRSKRVVTVAVTFLGLALLAGCQATGLPTGRPAQQTTINVAAIKGVDDAPFFVALKAGAFARAGLNIKLHTYGSVAQELQALGKGTVDIAAGDYVDFFSLVAKSGHPYLSIVADGYHAGLGVMEVLTLPGSGITTPQSLANHTIGTSQPQGADYSSTKPYSLETLATQSVMKNDGVVMSNVSWKPMPTANLIGALENHQVSAILVEEPNIFEAESKLGAVPVLDSCSSETANLPLSGYFATSAFVRDHPITLRTFRDVLQQAQKAAVLPGQIRAEIASQPGMTMQTSSLITLGAYPTTLNAASLQRVADLMFNAEMLSSSLNVSSMIAK